MPGEATDPSRQQLLANPRVDVGRAQRCLVQCLPAHPRPRLDLLIDSVTVGDRVKHAGTQTVCLALAWHGPPL